MAYIIIILGIYFLVVNKKLMDDKQIEIERYKKRAQRIFNSKNIIKTSGIPLRTK